MAAEILISRGKIENKFVYLQQKKTTLCGSGMASRKDENGCRWGDLPTPTKTTQHNTTQHNTMNYNYIERVIERHGVRNALDVALLRLCGEMDCTDWMHVENHLIPMAATEEARKALREVRITMYHEEEALCGCL